MDSDFLHAIGDRLTRVDSIAGYTVDHDDDPVRVRFTDQSGRSFAFDFPTLQPDSTVRLMRRLRIKDGELKPMVGGIGPTFDETSDDTVDLITQKNLSRGLRFGDYPHGLDNKRFRHNQGAMDDHGSQLRRGLKGVFETFTELTGAYRDHNGYPPGPALFEWTCGLGGLAAHQLSRHVETDPVAGHNHERTWAIKVAGLSVEPSPTTRCQLVDIPMRRPSDYDSDSNDTISPDTARGLTDQVRRSDGTMGLDRLYQLISENDDVMKNLFDRPAAIATAARPVQPDFDESDETSSMGM